MNRLSRSIQVGARLHQAACEHKHQQASFGSHRAASYRQENTSHSGVAHVQPGAARDGVAAHRHALGGLAHHHRDGRIQPEALLRKVTWTARFRVTVSLG